ncbi:Fur family transcriptional regulator [Endozoicomonas sp. ALD040]|uniref:Fur family transcriptional regulator n=1 Tax=unclassified Endozoicomonas TaxID=2644528 RepID=UPI003BAEE48E
MISVHQHHDHHVCISEALQEARILCQQRGVRLTHLREKVLELVWQSHQPVGAYEILAQLTKQEERVAQPPTVYRALDFLLEQGLVHRLSSLNAFIGCPHPGIKHNSCFLICEKCRVTQEIDHQAINQSISSCASDQGFKIVDTAIELTGLCSSCQKFQESL